MSRITPDNLDKWLFNLEEGNLTPAEERQLNQFLSAHPELMEEAEAWKMTHLSEPLAPISFEAELHAVAETGAIAWKRYAAMAGVLLLLGGTAWFFLSGEEDQTTDRTAENNSQKTDAQNGFNLFAYDHTSTYSSENNKNNGAPVNIADKNHRNGSMNSSENNSSSDNLASNEGAVGNTLHSKQKQNANHSLSSVMYADFIQKQNQRNALQNARSGNTGSAHKSLKNREQVTIDIVNNVTVINETEIIHVKEEVDPQNRNDLENENKTEITDEQNPNNTKKLPLPLKENINNHVIADNADHFNHKSKFWKKVDKFFKNNYDPNPTLTNLRDPYLLATNNNLTDSYGGFAGGMINARFSANYRNNWTGNEQINSQTAMFGYDQLMRKIKTGIAMNASYTDYSGGMFTTANASITISPKFKLGRGITLEPFVTGSYSQKTVNPGQAIAGSFIEDRRGNVLQLYRNGTIPEYTTAYAPDMKAGAVFQHKKFWTAVSVDHLLMPKEVLYNTTEPNMYKNDIEFKTTTGTDYIHRPEGAVYSPQMSIYYHDGYSEVWAGLNVRYRQLVIGAAGSQFKDFVTMLGFQSPKNNFKLVYQFDMTRSMLFNEKMPSHELSLRFSLNGMNKNPKSILISDK